MVYLYHGTMEPWKGKSMSDRINIEVSKRTWSQLKTQAFNAGMSLREYLAQLAEEQEGGTAPLPERENTTPITEKSQRNRTKAERMKATREDYDLLGLPYTEEGGFTY